MKQLTIRVSVSVGGRFQDKETGTSDAYAIAWVRDAMRGYLSVQETAEKWDVSVRWVNQYILNGRIPGVERLGKSWAIPEDSVKLTKQKSGPHSITDRNSLFEKITL